MIVMGDLVLTEVKSLAFFWVIIRQHVRDCLAHPICALRICQGCTKYKFRFLALSLSLAYLNYKLLPDKQSRTD